MTIEWKFPHNGFGQVRGVSDAGIETFTGTEIQSLAREICQNSLDAAVEGSNATIKVDFEQYRIPSSDIPGYEQYASKIQKAYDYWSKKNSEKTIKVLTKALNAIKKPTTVVLRISDFNTTGLSHPYEDSDEGWNALTKLDGGATKTGDKAGAFGIGKNAPFTNSDYRLVFYRTLNEDQETAAQGMSRFISFPEDLSNSMNTMTTGIGYYGNPEGNLPVDSISELEKLYQRSEIGTDVFVYGFNAGYEWNSDVINEVLENFLMSIHKNLLSVTVDNKNIDNSTLASYLSTYNSSLQDTIGSITIQPRTSKTKPKGLFYGSDGNGKSKNTDTEGTIGSDGGDPTTRNLGGTRHRSKKDSHKGRAEQGGHDTVHKRYGGDINQELKNVRVIKTSRTTYRVSFILPRDIRAGHVEIVTVGENGKSNRLAIHSASELMGCTGIKKSSEGVSFSSMKGNEKVQFEIALLDNRDYAMEVNVYEHN